MGKRKDFEAGDILVRAPAFGIRVDRRARRGLEDLADLWQRGITNALNYLSEHIDDPINYRTGPENARTVKSAKLLDMPGGTQTIYSAIRLVAPVPENLPSSLAESMFFRVASIITGHKQATKRWEWQQKIEAEGQRIPSGSRMTGAPAFPSPCICLLEAEKVWLDTLESISQSTSLQGHRLNGARSRLAKAASAANPRKHNRELLFTGSIHARILRDPENARHWCLAVQTGHEGNSVVTPWSTYQQTNKAAGPITKYAKGWLRLPLVVKQDYAKEYLDSGAFYGDVRLQEISPRRWQARISFKFNAPTTLGWNRLLFVVPDIYPYATAALWDKGKGVVEVRRYPTMEHMIPHERWVERAKHAQSAGRRCPSAPDERSVAHATSKQLVDWAGDAGARMVFHDPGEGKAWLLKARKNLCKGLSAPAQRAIRQANRVLSTWDYGRLAFDLDYKGKAIGCGELIQSGMAITDTCPECKFLCYKKNLTELDHRDYKESRRQGLFICPKCAHQCNWTEASVRILCERFVTERLPELRDKELNGSLKIEKPSPRKKPCNKLGIKDLVEAGQ